MYARFRDRAGSPHFGRKALEEGLRRGGIDYLWLPALGGHRRRPAGAPPSPWHVAAFAAYADHMRSPEFHAGIAELLTALAAHPTAIMCAEASPYRSHRRLISDGRRCTASRSCTCSTNGGASGTR